MLLNLDLLLSAGVVANVLLPLDSHVLCYSGIQRQREKIVKVLQLY